jgi:hypothetical protein
MSLVGEVRPATGFGLMLLLGGVLGGCDGIVGLGDERTLADAGVHSEAGPDAEAGVENPNNRCAERNQGVLWAMQFGDESYQVTSATAVGQGSFYVTGTFSGALDFGDGPLISQGKGDLFLVRFDSNGNYLWSKSFGDVNDQGQTVFRLRLTPDGGVLFYGDFVGTINFGDGVHTAADHDGFIARYDAAGKNLWTKVITSPGLDVVNDVAVHAASDTIVAAVQFGGPIVGFDGKSVSHKGGADILLAKLAADGSQIWSQSFGSGFNEMAQAVAVDASGRIAIAGQLDSPVNLGGGTLATVDAPDAFVAVYQSTGAFLWAKPYSGPGFQIAHRLAIAPQAGDLIVTGYLSGSTSFGGTNLSATNGAFLARLSAIGDHKKSIAIENFFVPRALVVDSQDNTLVSGPFGDITNFGGGQIATEGYQDGIVAKLGPGLEQLWTLQIGSIGYDNAWGVDSDESSHSFVAAYFQNEIELEGCGKLTSAGDADLLLIKLDK